jgi:hypothetical protein
MVRLLLLSLMLGTLLAISVDNSQGCGVAGRRDANVSIADERAIILWDAGSGIQHFIRQASFHADTPDFGFLVPTPSQPTLAEARSEAFSILEKLTAPDVITQNVYEIMPIGCGKSGPSPGNSVRVLDQQRVAGYDATVLEADSARDLNGWLLKHDYVTRPNLTDWLEPYVKNKWKITAFKIARDFTRQEIASSAVVMTFSTPRPFFPYSEPADKGNGTGSRLLRVFFLADRRFAGELGPDKQPWQAGPVWAGRLADNTLQELAAQLPLFDQLHPVWLTVFDDHSVSRAGKPDLFFVPTSRTDEVRRPPITVRERVFLGGWLCLAIALLLIALPVIRVLLNRRRAAL